MLFNSFEFIYLFLPTSLAVYFLLNRQRLTLASKAWLVSTSLFFYSWWNIRYLPLILGSIVFNYAVGTSFTKREDIKKKSVLVLGIFANIALLGYFKYVDFFISNINTITNSNFNLLRIALPLGISFFTFTQIAYLIDSYRSEAREYNFLNYSLFVTFFPHLLAGPIIHHKEMMPQFDRRRNKVLNYRNLSLGMYLFFIGLAKKVFIADAFAVYANSGLDIAGSLTMIDAWITSLSYTMQLYFDFSGYTDMAIGTALMFNIKLPINFNSPYKALNIQDFWRRWHITLSRFLRDYIYIPLGGNRTGEFRIYSNLMITFLIGGLWHGAGWTFVFWGFLHGAGIVANRAWKKMNINMPKILAWFLTFNFVNVAWIFFRAKDWGGAVKVLKGMLGMNGAVLDLKGLGRIYPNIKSWGLTLGFLIYIIDNLANPILMLGIGCLSIFFLRNSNEMYRKFQPSKVNIIFTAFLIFCGLLYMLLANKQSEFLYFNF